MLSTTDDVEVAVDNDLILKAACYGLTDLFWPADGPTAGVLGAARYVVSHRIDKAELSRDIETAQAEFASFLARNIELEPTEAELELASEIERVAQLETLSLDSGESQLGAVVITRTLDTLETGDKRAIRGFERLVDLVDGVEKLNGKIRCLEQIVLRVVVEQGGCKITSSAVCAELDVDKALSICFSCYSSDRADNCDSAIEGLRSYVENLRGDAPRVLVAS